MQFTVKTQELLEAVKVAGRAVSKKAVTPGLGGILLKAITGKVVVTATDLELWITTSAKANTTVEGEGVVNAALLQELLESFSAEELEVETKEKETQIYFLCGEYRSRLDTVPRKEFPGSPPFVTEKNLILNCEKLAQAILDVEFCAAQEDAEGKYSGILIDIEDGMVRLVATDRHRLGISTVQLPEAKKTEGIVVSAKHLQTLARLIKGTEKIEFNWNKNALLAKTDNLSFLIRGLVSPFPQSWRDFLSTTDLSTTFTVDTDLLSKAVKAVLVVARDASKSVVIEGKKDPLILRAMALEVGELEAKVKAVVKGEGLVFAVNGRYLLEALGVLPKTVLVEVNSRLIRLKETEGERVYLVIAPVAMPAAYQS